MALIFSTSAIANFGFFYPTMILCVFIYLHSHNQYMYVELQGPEIYT